MTTITKDYGQMNKIDEILNKHAQEFKAGHLGKVKAELLEVIKTTDIDLPRNLKRSSDFWHGFYTYEELFTRALENLFNTGEE